MKTGEQCGLTFNTISVMIEKSTWSDTKTFLREHEKEIVLDLDGFGLLVGLFRSIVGRYPEVEEENRKW